jgi:hypothetical protein
MTEIVFAARSMKARRPLLVVVYVDHFVSFAPPASLKMRDGKITSDVVTAPLGFEDDIVAIPIQVRDVHFWAIDLKLRRPALTRIYTMPMRVKIRDRLWQRFAIEFIVNVEVLRVRDIVLILESNPRLLLEWHREVAVEGCASTESMPFLRLG